MRGVWRQALSLPRPLILWGGQPGFCDPCVRRAVGAGVGTQHQSRRVCPCGPALRAVVLAEGCPRGGTYCGCEGYLTSGAPSSPAARPPGGLSGPAIDVLWARARGCGGPALSPWRVCPVGAACRGGGWGPSSGGMACPHCEGRLVSGAVPPLAAHRLWTVAGVPRSICPGCGWCGRGDPAASPQRAPLQAGVTRCGAGGRASPGGVPFAVVGGV